ncbi:unnamed protein product [Owenia fusiformis]|uniref:Uncharacterized protein n=1 Tax=Owenia fusiformis TaxID=6347 RepID=A0A8J1XYU5_OWEFU|nr:unnamed protein product [Owenia fusiformis]
MTPNLLHIFALITLIKVISGNAEGDGVFNMDQRLFADELPDKDRPNEDTTIHVIFMNHLDVGYNGIAPKIGFINNVLNTYFHEHFPRAVKVAKELREGGFVETFKYTTHPWLLSMYFDCPPNLVLSGVKLKCPNATQIKNMTEAIHAGDITWHAGAMNMQSEMMAEFLLEFSLFIGMDLDKKFGIKRDLRVLSQRDVPGLTNAVIPTLKKWGVEAVSVGVNPFTSPPAVPAPVFRWGYEYTDPHGSQQSWEVLGLWHPGGYPMNPGPNPANPGGLSKKDCHIIPNFKHVLCFAFRTDNSGPPESVQEILLNYEILRAEFPGANIRASSFEDYIQTIDAEVRSTLPLTYNEIGDTWIQGIASDPRKNAEYRVVSGLLEKCLSSGACSFEDKDVYNATRFLLKTPEHTWGLPSVNDNVNWTNTAFNKAKSGANYKNCTLSWLEQREFSRITVETLKPRQVAYDMEKAIKELDATLPDLANYEKMTFPSERYTCPTLKNMEVTFSNTGAINHLSLTDEKKEPIKWKGTLGEYTYHTYNLSDFDNFAKQYTYLYGNVFYKTNLTNNTHAESRKWSMALTELYRSKDADCTFLLHLIAKETEMYTYYGAPKEIWQTYTISPEGVDITLELFGKTSTRMPEASFVEFVNDGDESSCHWDMVKIGRPVSFYNVMKNGSQYQHVVEGLLYKDGVNRQFSLKSPDVPLISPIVYTSMPTPTYGPTPFPVPLGQITRGECVAGIGYNIHNNVWSTNYVLWYPLVDEDKDMRYRYYLAFI